MRRLLGLIDLKSRRAVKAVVRVGVRRHRAIAALVSRPFHLTAGNVAEVALADRAKLDIRLRSWNVSHAVDSNTFNAVDDSSRSEHY